MKVSILTRISTSSQSNDSSLNELRSICKKKDYDIVEEYVEVVSGSKGKDERSELRRMLSDCKKGKFKKQKTTQINISFLFINSFIESVSLILEYI